VTAYFEIFCKMKIPYSLNEKILLASLIHDMEEAKKKIKKHTVSVERKNSVFSLLVIKANVIGCHRTLRSFVFLRWPSDR
jgi:hypothetical protein